MIVDGHIFGIFFFDVPSSEGNTIWSFYLNVLAVHSSVTWMLILVGIIFVGPSLNICIQKYLLG